MPSKEEDDNEIWNFKRLDFIENDDTNIDENLLTLTTPTICHLNMYFFQLYIYIISYLKNKLR